MRRALVLLPALALLAACDRDGGNEPDRLSPEVVAGVYNLCTLRFQPSNAALPSADLLRTVVDTTPPAGRPEATIALAQNAVYDMVYTTEQSAFLAQFRGSIEYMENGVSLSVPSNDEDATLLLLPRPLQLSFNATTRRLTGDVSGFPHPVARADYARAAGISEEGLQNTINGSLTVVFSANTCP